MTLCFVYERPSVRNEIFLLCCDNVDRIFFELQCIHCYQTSVNLGVGGWVFFLGGGGSTRRIPVFTSRLYFSWRNINQTCSSLLLSLQLSSQLGEGVTFEEGLLLLLLLYRLYMQSGCRSNFFEFYTVWTCCAVESLLTSDVCTRETNRKEVSL